jgi:hypothetical protein
MKKEKHGRSDIGLVECDNNIKRVSYLLYLNKTYHEEEGRPGSALAI